MPSRQFRPQGKGTEARMLTSVAPKEVLARLGRGVSKPQGQALDRSF
jgi:hypothetical protein